MLEVIIELTAAESNIPYVVCVLPFSAFALSGTTLSNTKLLLLFSVVRLISVGSNIFNLILTALPSNSSQSYQTEVGGQRYLQVLTLAHP